MVSTPEIPLVMFERENQYNDNSPVVVGIVSRSPLNSFFPVRILPLLFNYCNTLPIHVLPFLYAMYKRGSTETLIIIASASKLRYIPLAYLGNVIEPSGMFSDA